ncbi:MAG: GNAT family N-acetyltransferase [Flavobacterium sp.]|nr:GNAT family N-acetyltransferase [Flavobacterium sp.]
MTTFKPLEVSDIPIIVEMMQEFYAIDSYPIDVEKSKLLFSEFISNKNHGKGWLICHSDEKGIPKIAGYAILTFVFSFEYGGTIAFIDELYIKESHRGKGIGKTSIAFLKAEAAKLSLKLLYLEVENHNSTAQKLYLATGFELHKRNIMKYKVQ